MKTLNVELESGTYVVFLDDKGNLIREQVLILGQSNKLIPWSDIVQAVQDAIISFVNDYLKSQPVKFLDGKKTYLTGLGSTLLGIAVAFSDRIVTLDDNRFMVVLAGIALIVVGGLVTYSRNAVKAPSKLFDILPKLK